MNINALKIFNRLKIFYIQKTSKTPSTKRRPSQRFLRKKNLLLKKVFYRKKTFRRYIFKQKSCRIPPFEGSHTMNFHIKENVLWREDLQIPIWSFFSKTTTWRSFMNRRLLEDFLKRENLQKKNLTKRKLPKCLL